MQTSVISPSAGAAPKVSPADIFVPSAKPSTESPAIIAAPPKPDNHRNPLRKFSLAGSLAKLEQEAQEQTPLLGDLCLRGQATVWYAKPNVGKTLITLHLLREAIARSSIDGSDVYYVAADDNSAGVIEKLKILQPYGVHVLAPGFNGLQAKDLPQHLRSMIDGGTVGGTFLILDTLKKFVSLMDKRDSTAFAELARLITVKGGSILGLAHTNKRLGTDGKPIFAGTSDILDDFDGGYTIIELSQQSNRSERVVQFECIKSRGNLAQQVAYAYSVENGLSYSDLLDSVRMLDADTVSQLADEADQAADADVVAAIEACIREGVTAKMDIARTVTTRCSIGRQGAVRIIDKYTGSNPSQHRWTFSVGNRGRQDFSLLADIAPGGCAPGEVF